MEVLILGGTHFLGRHLAESLVAAGYDVVVLHRGLTGPGLYSKAQTIIADRAEIAGIDFGGRRFDAVIDTCGYTPGLVELAANVLRDIAPFYVFVSTVSVYDLRCDSVNEDSRTLDLPAGVDANIKDETFYGELKALCEREVRAIYGKTRCLVVRPGLIAGPYDFTDRFSYWPWRVSVGGDIIAPVSPDYRIQCIDARDLAAWIVRCISTRTFGTYNATSPSVPFSTLIDAASEPHGKSVRMHYLSDQALERAGVGPWIELPLWNAKRIGYDALFNIDLSRAVSHGLQIRPMRETCRDTLAWLRTRENHQWKAGLSAEREAQILRIPGNRLF